MKKEKYRKCWNFSKFSFFFKSEMQFCSSTNATSCAIRQLIVALNFNRGGDSRKPLFLVEIGGT